jgi:hypothetical protein
MRTKIILTVMIAVFWIASLVGTAAIAQAGRPPVAEPPTTQPDIITGVDVGFRITRYRGEVPVGVLIIRKDGKWVAVEFDAGMKVIR